MDKIENEILDHFEEEKPPPPELLNRVNSVVGILVIGAGGYLIFNMLYWYNAVSNTLVPSYYFYENYDLLAWLSFGALLLSGGYKIIRKEKLGIEIIRVTSIALVIYALIMFCFETERWQVNIFTILPYFILAIFLYAYSKWKNLPHLYSNLSLPSYLCGVGIIVGIIPFIFFWKELVS